MNFLEKLDWLKERNGIPNNKKLSELSGIPYSTIVGFYKKGFAGLRLPTLEVLADFFDVSLDTLVREEITNIETLTEIADRKKKEEHMLSLFRRVPPDQRQIVLDMIEAALKSAELLK